MNRNTSISVSARQLKPATKTVKRVKVVKTNNFTTRKTSEADTFSVNRAKKYEMLTPVLSNLKIRRVGDGVDRGY